MFKYLTVRGEASPTAARQRAAQVSGNRAPARKNCRLVPAAPQKTPPCPLCRRACAVCPLAACFWKTRPRSAAALLLLLLLSSLFLDKHLTTDGFALSRLPAAVNGVSAAACCAYRDGACTWRWWSTVRALGENERGRERERRCQN